MSTKGFIRLETAEGGIEYWDGSTKIAFINDSGTVQATRGNADRKAELEEWLHALWSRPHVDEEENPVPPPYLPGESIPYHKWQSENSAPESEPETGAVSETDSDEDDLTGDLVRDWKRFGNETKDSPPVCPIPGDSQSGSKSPEVVAWWFDNHPEQARVKYANHKHLWPQ